MELNELYAQIATAQNYLNDTDWMVIRHSETGVEIPEEVLSNRAEKRDEIDRIREEISRMLSDIEETINTE